MTMTADDYDRVMASVDRMHQRLTQKLRGQLPPMWQHPALQRQLASDEMTLGVGPGYDEAELDQRAADLRDSILNYGGGCD
jgi:hypothetical protein